MVAAAKTDLEKIAAEVRQEVKELNTSIRTALAHAIRVGELLLQAKEEFQRGSWERWVRKECHVVGKRQAQKFMQLARHQDKMKQEDADWMNKLTINEALARLRKVLRPDGEKEREQGSRAQPADTVELHTRRCERFARFANGELRKGEQKVLEVVESEVAAFASDVIKAARRHGRQLVKTGGLGAADADPVLLGMLLCARLKLDPTSDFAPMEETEENDEEPVEQLAAVSV